MPYTPPTPRSPATSTKVSPAITRNHSYDKSAPNQSRPELPRSRSAQYLQKHRRTPSLADSHQHQHGAAQHHGLHTYQSPVTYSDGTSAVVSGLSYVSGGAVKPVAAENLTMSPVEAGSSEDDEDRGRSRQIATLAESLKSNPMIVTKRQHSPSKDGQNGEKPTSLVVDTAALTPEARKIAHSRSNSEMLSIPVNQLAAVYDQSTEDSDEDALEMRRVPLVRKKSGELVKPALRGTSARRRPISAPGTPSFPKAVHFNENIEQVRHFLQIDKPSAVSADSSPVETYESESEYPFIAELSKKPRGPEWTISTNLPKDTHERQCLPVRVDQLTLSKDGKTLNGVVAVANISYDKWVFARFTFDYWKTTSEIACEWTNVRYASSTDGFDRFTFSIKLSDQANLQNKTLFLCAKYNVAGQEHWDNNSGANYQVDFARNVAVQKKPAPKSPNSAQTTPSGAGIPRSRNTAKGSIPRPRSFPIGSSDDEFSTAYESPFRLRGKMNNRNTGAHTFADQAQQAAGNKLSIRYDFNASLHAALATAQDALGDQSGLQIKHLVRPSTAPASSASALPPKRIVQIAQVTSEPKTQSTSDAASSKAEEDNAARPTLGSAEYQALIQKFCYFGSPMGNNTADTSPQPELVQEAEHAAPKEDMEAVRNLSSDDSTNSTSSSTSNSPPSPKVHLHQPEPKLAPKQELNLDQRASARTPSPSLLARSPRLHPFRTPSPALSSASAYAEFPHQGLSIQSLQC